MIFGKLKPSDLGPTGRFPDGKISPDDDGEILMGMRIEKGRIILQFGKPTTWIGMDKKLALEMAEKLRELAGEIE